MAWERCTKIAGTVYVPTRLAGDCGPRCPDCYACQQCGAERCAVCVAGDYPSIKNDRRPPAASGKTLKP